MANYYDDVLERIKKEILNNQYEKANEIICEELRAPYVPFDFEDKLNNLRQQIIENIECLKGNNINWDVNKVLEIMAKKLDQDFHLMAFEALRGLNARLIINEIEQYLIDQEIKPEYKSFLLMVLIEQNIDKDIKIEKNNNVAIFNPTKFNLYESQNLLKDIELLIEKIVYNENPSLFSICSNILNSYFYYTFPFLNFNHFYLDEMAFAIIKKACIMLGIDFDNNWQKKLQVREERIEELIKQLNEIV